MTKNKNSLLLAVSKNRFTFNDSKKNQADADDHAQLIASIATQVVSSSMDAFGLNIDEVMEISSGAARLHHIYANRESSPRIYRVERILEIQDVERKNLGTKAKIIYEAEDKDGKLGEEEIITDFYQNERENDSFECMNARAILDLMEDDFEGPFFFTKAYYTGVENKHSKNGTAKFLANVQRIGDYNDDDRLRATESEKEAPGSDEEADGEADGDQNPEDILGEVAKTLVDDFGEDYAELSGNDEFLDATFDRLKESFDVDDDTLNPALDTAIDNEHDGVAEFVIAIYEAL